MGDEEGGTKELLPYRAEYAKSSRASCRGCKETIAQDTLRLAVMVQSPHFDGKIPNWYHFSCFWKRARVAKIEDIHGFHQLRWEDQQKIEQQVQGGSGGGASSSSKKKGKKTESVEAADPHVRDFKVEYAKSGGSKCRTCEDKIPKGDARLGKMDYESEQAQMYGPQTHWHHVQCFVDKRVDLGFTMDLNIETVSGFKALEKEDRDRLVTLLGKGEARPKSVTNNNGSKAENGKKRKVKGEEAENGEPKKPKDDLNDQLKAQNDMIWKIRDQLQDAPGLTSRDMKEFLELNDQHVPVAGKLVERIADCLAFGALEHCPECKKGHMVYSDTANAYRCLGQITEWAKCEYTVKTPKRRALIIPDGEPYDSIPIFSKYKFVKKERIFPPDRVQEGVVKKEEAGTSYQTDFSKPLNMLKFVLCGRMSKPINEMRQALTNLGATIAADVDGTVIALIAGSGEVKKGSKSKQIQAAETADIHVVSEDFIQAALEAAKVGKLKVILPDPNQPSQTGQPDGTINLADLVLKHQAVANVGGNVESRIKLNLTKSANLASKSFAVKSSAKSDFYKSGQETKRFKVKGRSAVDPDSGLEDEAHVLEEGNCIWNCVLNLVSVTSGTNSYYRLQLLEKDTGSTWWVFRAWGRIGTTIGGTKLEKYKDKREAKDEFESLFLDKTGHDWYNGKYSRDKVPGKFFPVDVDFGVDPDEQIKSLSLMNAGSGSKLPPSVKDLIRLIFDVKMMQKMMAEMEIDLRKMPLGKLSKTQIQQAYGVLSEIQNLLEGSSSQSQGSNRQYMYIDASNRFYSLIPHDFGMNAPPLLDSIKAVQEKTLMLDELMEIELAYRMLSEDGSQGKEDPLDVHYKQLKTQIVPVDRESDEFRLLEKYVKNTHAATHSTYKLVIQDVFRIEREGESSRFEPFRKMANHKLLWHGSRLTNYVGILSQGLRIAPPEAPSTGYMFGKGVYFADMVSKSANYCYTSSANSTGLVLLGDVALGKEHEVKHATSFVKPPPGFDSVKGVGMTCPDPSGTVRLPVVDAGYELEIPAGKSAKSEVSGSSLLYNEFIVYDVAQVRLRYLLRMDFKYAF